MKILLLLVYARMPLTPLPPLNRASTSVSPPYRFRRIDTRDGRAPAQADEDPTPTSIRSNTPDTPPPLTPTNIRSYAPDTPLPPQGVDIDASTLWIDCAMSEDPPPTNILSYAPTPTNIRSYTPTPDTPLPPSGRRHRSEHPLDRLRHARPPRKAPAAAHRRGAGAVRHSPPDGGHRQRRGAAPAKGVRHLCRADSRRQLRRARRKQRDRQGRRPPKGERPPNTLHSRLSCCTHTHTHIYIYIHIHIFIYVKIDI